MSFHFYLYRAPDDLPAMNQWQQMHALALGTAEEVKERLSALYPELSWERREQLWLARGPNGVDDRYLDLMLCEEQPGKCFFVVLNKAAPSTMRRVMEAMGLNYVCAPESGHLVDPYAYDDHDRYYARR